MNSVDEILSRLEKLDGKINFIQADVNALRQDSENDRAEYRREIVALRGDLAQFANRFATLTDDAKKKLIETPIPYKSLSPKSPKPSIQSTD